MIKTIKNKILKKETLEDYRSLMANRTAIYNFLIELSKMKLPEPIVEIGPMIDDREFNPTSVFHKFPEFFIDSRSLFMGKKYFSIDIIKHPLIDYCGSVYNLKQFFQKESVGTFIMFSVLEHLEKVWIIPSIIYELLKKNGLLCFQTPWNLRFHGPRPDCWRISDDGYKALFSDYFNFSVFKKIENPKRPLSPYGFYGILKKKKK